MLNAIVRLGFSYSKLLLAVGIGLLVLGSPVNSSATTSIILKGTILPMDHEEGLNRYVLEYGGHKSVFQVDDVRLMGFSGDSGNQSGWSILNSIGRQKLIVRGGNEQAVRDLTEPSGMCKGIRLQGTLYVSSGTLLLGSVNPVPAVNRPEMCD